MNTDPPAVHPGFQRTFAPGRLTLGMQFPIEAFEGEFPSMAAQMELASRAEELGFATLWVRDVPLWVPKFNDVGQVYDPWVWLGNVVAHTQRIALATGGIALTLRHPLHVAKAAASVDQLSRGRFVLGGASGDRVEEGPAFGVSHDERGERYRDCVYYLTRALRERFPEIVSPLGTMRGVDLIPKPYAGWLPLLAVGRSRQTLDWIATHADGWIDYARDVEPQARMVRQWERALARVGADRFKPFSQALAVDLQEDADAPARRIFLEFYGKRVFLGYRLGRNVLRDYLERLQEVGVNHVSLILRLGRRPAPEVLEEIGETLIPSFPAHVDPVS